MNKKILSVVLAAAFAVTFSSCEKKEGNTTVVQNSEQTSSADKPFFPDDADIDIQKCIASTTEYFTDETNGFPKMDFSIQAPGENTKNNFVIIMVLDEAPEDRNIYIELMEKCLEKLNHEAAVQDPRISEANETSYGGLYQKYGITVTSTNLSEMLSLWSIDQTIEAGSDDRLELNDNKIDLNSLQ